MKCENYMSNSLYEEAIQAAEQIKRAAEDKVKQQLVESMSPKIKLMVEKALLDEEELHTHDDEKHERTRAQCAETHVTHQGNGSCAAQETN